MPIARPFAAGLALLALAGSALAGPALAGITVQDAYFRAASPMAKSGAAFMVLLNDGDTDDRLIAAASDIAVRVELHTHFGVGNGVMQMREVEEGFAIPAGGSHALERGGDHVMFMGLREVPQQGARVTVTLTFENAGEIRLDIPVDLTRVPGMGATKNDDGS